MAYNEAELTDSSIDLTGSPFPNEFVNPETKEKDWYGLKYVKAIYDSRKINLGGAKFWNTEDYNSMMEVAQGRASVDNIRKMFGYFQDPDGDAGDDGSADLAYLDIQVLNLAPKYINRAVDKMMAREYEYQLEAIDVVSVHEKKTYEAALKAYFEYKTWLQEMGMDPKQFFPDVDLTVIPEFPDEMIYEITTNPKIKKAIEGEEALQLIQEINDFKEKRRISAWFTVVFGRSSMDVFRDENGIPRVKNINPKHWIGSYVEDENFKDQEYAGYYEFLTINQFRKEARPHLSSDKIEEIVKKYGFDNSFLNGTGLDSQIDGDGLTYIPVLRFKFLSQDDRVFVQRKNKNGNDTLLEMTLNWKNEKEGDRVIRNSYTSVYGGTWVVDSDCVYNYGRIEFPRSNLVDATLPIITFSPNYREGRTVSFLSQMIEPLFMINVAWNKIKEILAKGWMGYQTLDFTQLESVAIGKGGKPWSPREVYKHFLQTGRLITRSQVNKYDQRYSNSAIDSSAAGLQLADYFTAFSTGIQMLEQMTNTNVASSVQQPDRLAVAVAEQSQVTSDYDMGYLYNADEYMCKAVCHQLLLFTQEAKRDGISINGFVPALGQHVEVSEEIAYCDLGLFLKHGPTEQEWADFRAGLVIGLDKGQITHADYAFIIEIKNLKKARQILAQRVKINERKMAQIQQANTQNAIESTVVATQEKLKADLQVAGFKANEERKNIVLKGQIDENLMTRQKELEGVISDKTDFVKKQISKQQSVDKLVQQAMQNSVEREKVDKRADKSPKD